MEQAVSVTSKLKADIARTGEAIKASSRLSASQLQQFGRELTNAGKLADRLGSQSQSLVADERELTHAVDEQKLHLASLKDDYAATQERIDSLSGTYDTIKQATAGLDLTTPLAKQREQVAAEVAALDAQIKQLSTGLSSGKNLVSFGGNWLNLNEAKQALNSLVEQSASAGERLADLDYAIQSIGEGNLGYATANGLKQLQSEIGKSKDHLKQLEMQSTQTQSRLTAYGERLANVRQKQQDVSQSTAELRSRLSQINAASGGSSGLNRLAQAASALKSRLAGIGASVVSGITHPIQTAGRLGKAALSGIGSVAKTAWSGLSGIVSRFRSVGSSAKASTGGVTGLVRQIRNIGVVSLGLNMVRSLFGGLRSVVSSYISSNETLSNSVERLRNGLGQALAPAINVVIHAMERLLPYVVGVANAIGSLLTNLFGAGWTSIADGASSAASATEDATAAQEAYNKTLAGFDEINKLSDSNSGSGSSGRSSAGSSSAAVEGKLPAWLTGLGAQLKAALLAGDWRSLGTILGTKFNEVVNMVNWGGIGSTIGYALNGAIQTAYYTLKTADFAHLGTKVAEMLNSGLGQIDGTFIGRTLVRWHTAGLDFLIGGITGLDWGLVGKTLGDAIKGALDEAQEWIAGIDWGELTDQLYQDLKDAIVGLDLSGIATSFFRLLGSALGAAVSVVGTLVADIWEDITRYFADYLTNDDGTQKCGMDWVAGLLEGIWDGIKGIGTWIYDNVCQPILDGFKDAFGIHSPSTVMAELGGYLIEGLLLGLSDTWNGITGFFSNAWDGVKAIVSGAWNTIKTTATNAWSAVTGTVTTAATGIYSTVKDKLSGVASTASSKFDSVKSSIVTAASSIYSTISSKFDSVKSKVASTFSSLKSSATTWGKDICSNLSSGITSAISKVTSAVTKVADKIKSLIGFSEPEDGPLSNFHTYMPDMLDLMAQGIRDNAGTTLGEVSRLAADIAEEMQLDGFSVSGSALAGPVGVAGNSYGLGTAATLANWSASDYGWVDRMADRVASRMASSGGSSPQTITVQCVLDGRVVAENTIRYVNREARRTGVHPMLAGI